MTLDFADIYSGVDAKSPLSYAVHDGYTKRIHGDDCKMSADLETRGVDMSPLGVQKVFTVKDGNDFLIAAAVSYGGNLHDDNGALLRPAVDRKTGRLIADIRKTNKSERY